MLYAFAFILDPRAKMKGFSNVLKLLSELNGNDYSCYLTELGAELSIVFAKYDEKFGAVRLQRVAQPDPIGKKRTAWGKIFGDDASGSSSSSAAGCWRFLASSLGSSFPSNGAKNVMWYFLHHR
jgi:hypothetical protein